MDKRNSGGTKRLALTFPFLYVKIHKKVIAVFLAYNDLINHMMLVVRPTSNAAEEARLIAV